MLPVVAHRCWPSDTKTFSKGKNEADAAAGELPAQAGLGKQHSARGQVGWLHDSSSAWRHRRREPCEEIP